ncbi:hypothetical protein IWW38_000901 [Coemansia aciculifera]|uniref:Uncharacterized protein n=1 Tax=Coemansia aciculifera TaxID=417176 RepID=A0ACC1M8N5_9FUNG|nr:hypothetical protein IWW38_000901 [Coemansia aciculifera]
MATFFSSLLGRKTTVATPDDAAEKPPVIFDYLPRLEPAADMPIEHTPTTTPEEQQSLDLITQQRDTLLADLPAQELIEDDGEPPLETLSSEWLTTSRMLIYLRASKGDHALAIKRLRATLEWRATYRPYAITPAMMKQEGATGKMYVNGYDRGGRPLVYMFPHRENTSDAKEHLRYIVFTMEQAIRAMPAAGVTKLTIVIDASRFSPLAQGVPLSTAREFLSVLENHYPDRLHKALVLSPPTYFVMFYHLVAPFIDPVTKAKIAFVDLAGVKGKGCVDGAWVDIKELVDPSMLQSNAGGDWNYEFSQNEYWPALERSYNEAATT